MPEGSRFTLDRYKVRRCVHSIHTSCVLDLRNPCPCRPAHVWPQFLADKKLIQKRSQLDIVDELKPVAAELGCSMAQVHTHTPRPLLHSMRTKCAQMLGAAPDCPPARALTATLGHAAFSMRVQLALAWCASNPRVSTVITGATKLGQIDDNLGALEVLPKLTPEVKAKIEGIVGPCGAE